MLRISVYTISFQVNVNIPFFLHDFTVEYSAVQSCAETLQVHLVTQMLPAIQNISADMGAHCPNVSLAENGISIPDMLTLCQKGFRFHSRAGQCVYCGECSETVTSTTATTTSQTTTVTESATEQTSVSTEQTTDITTTTTEEPTTTTLPEPTTTERPTTTVQTTGTPTTKTPTTTTTEIQTTTSDKQTTSTQQTTSLEATTEKGRWNNLKRVIV